MKNMFLLVGLSAIAFAACGNDGHSLGGEDETHQPVNGRDSGEISASTGGSSSGTPSSGGEPCPNYPGFVGQTFPGCRLENGECGVDMTLARQYTVSSDGTHHVAGGCQPVNQVGRLDPIECPSMGTLLGTLNGCCRADDTCGYDFSTVTPQSGESGLPVGCVPQ